MHEQLLCHRLVSTMGRVTADTGRQADIIHRLTMDHDAVLLRLACPSRRE